MKQTMLRYFLIFYANILFFICVGQQKGSSRSESCSIKIVLADFDTKLPLNGQFGVYTKDGDSIIKVFKGNLELTLINDCDSIYISPKQSIYQDTLLTDFVFNDTVYLRSNSYEFEEVQISGKKSRQKKYKLGERNRKANHFYSFQSMEVANELDGEFFNFKFVSPLLNNVNKKVTIESMYIFVDGIPKDSIPNLYISFYKNGRSGLGKPIAEKLKFKKIDQFFLLDDNRGWAEVVFRNKLVLPKSGCILVLEKMNLSDYSPGVAFINTRKGLNLSTYTFLEHREDGHIYPHTIIKTYIKAFGK